MTIHTVAIVPHPLVTSRRDTMGGIPCFTGTRVPVMIVFEYVDDGESLEVFLENYPGVTRAHAEAVLKLSRADLVTAVTLATIGDPVAIA